MKSSPYSFRAIKTYSDNYVEINNIPNFTEEKPFSLDCQFYLTGNNDGILISHEGGMSLYIKEDKIYYKQNPDSTPFKVAPIALNCFINIIITFDLEKYTFYLDGYKISSNKSKTYNYKHNENGFVIGKDIKGYFSYVRFYNECLTEEKAFKNTFEEPKNSKFYAWFDFTGQQIIDKGPYNIDVRAIGLSCQYTLFPALELTGDNYAYIDKTYNTEISEYTVLGHIWPKYSINNIMTVFDNNLSDIGKGISVRLVKNETKHDGYSININMGMYEFTSQNTMNMNEWSDFGISVYSDKIIIYINDTEESFIINEKIDLKGQRGSVFGVCFDKEKTANYDFAMEGYISYIAEFDKALNSNEINKYFENPPYYFDEHLISNYTFYGECAEDIKSWKEVGFYGKDGSISLVEDTRISAIPKSFSIYIPESEDPEWKNYTEDEKWQIKWMANMLDECFSILFDVKIKSTFQNNLWHTRIAPVLRRFMRRNDYIRLMETTPNITTEALMRWLNSLFRNGYQLLLTLWTQTVAMDINTKAMTGAIVLAIAVPTFTNLYNSIGSKADKEIDKDSSDRPDPPPEPVPVPEAKDLQLRLKSVKYNHKSDGTIGGIHIKLKSGKENAQIPEWQFDKNSENNPAIVAVVREDIKRLKLDVTVQAYLKNMNSATTNISVSFNHPATGELVKVTSEKFVVKNEELKTISIDLPICKSNFDVLTEKYNICMYWKYYQPVYGLNNNMGRTYTNLYLLYKKPTQIFVCEYNKDYDGKNKYPSEYGLDVAIKLYKNGLKHKKNMNFLNPNDVGIANNITIGLNTSYDNDSVATYIYDTTNGASRYIINDAQHIGRFILDEDKFLDECENVDDIYEINCMDCAFIIQNQCAIEGVYLSVTKMTSVIDYIETNAIIPIGRDNEGWQVPFNGGFSFHAVAVDNDIPQGVEFYDIRIYDACLKLDYGAYPSNNQNANPLIPTNNPFSYTYNPVVNIQEPYTQMYYREHLIKNGKPCEIFYSHLNNINNIESFNNIVDSHFNVSKTLEQFTMYFNKNTNLEDIVFPSDIIGLYNKCKTKQEIKISLLGMLSLVSSPELKENKELEIGNVCYTNGDKKRLIIFYRNEYVFYLLGKSDDVNVINYAKELDDKLK